MEPNRNRNNRTAQNRTAPEPNRRGTLETEPEKGSSRSLALSLSLPGMGSGVCPPLPPHANAHLRVLAGFVSPRGYVHWGLSFTKAAERFLKVCSQTGRTTLVHDHK